MNNSPLIILQLNGANGPLSGAKMYATAAGSTNPKLVYFDKDLTVPCPSPLIADASGIFAQFFLESGEYRFQFYDANDVLIATRDYVSSAGEGGSSPVVLDYKVKVIQEDTVPHFLQYKLVPQSDSITQTVVNNPTFGKQISLSVREDWIDGKIADALIPYNFSETFPESMGSFGGKINYDRLVGYNHGVTKSVTFLKLLRNPLLQTLKDITLILSGSTGSYGFCVYDTDSDEPVYSSADLRWSVHIDGHTSADPYAYVNEVTNITLKKNVWLGITFYFPASGVGTWTNEGPFMFLQTLNTLFNTPGASVLGTFGSAYKFDLCSIVNPGFYVTYMPAFSPNNYVPWSYYSKLSWEGA
jgi:hypothetical protein